VNSTLRMAATFPMLPRPGTSCIGKARPKGRALRVT
jgi:hypothetical protein